VWGSDDSLVVGAEGTELAERIHQLCVDGACDAVNLRIFLAGLSPAEVRAQIERHGAETIPRLRTLLGPSA
jgi:hypothetical protein